MGNVRIIGASAGSGKTYRLAYEYIKEVVSDPALYRHILAVTFTNKATEEMKSRILREIHMLASGGQSSYTARLQEELGFSEEKIRHRAAEARKLILHDYSRFSVLTIDRFFQRLIRSFIRELGVEVNFNLQLETDDLLSVAADMLIEDISTDEELRRRLFLAARDRIEENKRWNIKEPLLGLGKQLFGEAYQRARDVAPQEGQASSLIEAVVEKAWKVQAEIISRAKAASDMIEAHALSASDFKGKSGSVAAYFSQVAAGDVKAPSKYAAEALRSPGNWVHPDSENRGTAEFLVPELMPLLEDMDKLYSENFRLMNSASLLRENYRNFLLLYDLQHRVEKICSEGNIMPISETNRMISRLVSGNDTPFIFEKAGSYYSRFMIDEFQDTSGAQWDNFVPLLKNAIAEEEGAPVMLIGDVKQAIYRWRGGDWRILSQRVSEEMGAGRVERETLVTNWRSMRRVVEFNNAVTGLVTEAGNAELNAMIARGFAKGMIDATEAESLTGMMEEAYRGHIQQPKSEKEEGYVTITVYDAGGNGEYVPPVIEKIEELQSRGYAPGEIAVLVRSNDQGTRVAQMLLKHKHDNPGSPYSYDVVTQEALTVGSAAVSRFIIACLSLAADPGDSINRAVYNHWLGRSFDEPLSKDENGFFAHMAAMSPEEAFEETVLRYCLQGRADDIAYIQAIHEQINNFSSKQLADIPLFLKWWGEKGAAASISMQGGGAITVSTIHKSKGLEYKAVIIPYMSWTLAPDTRGKKLIVWAESPEEGLEGVGSLPVNYREQMSESFFAPGYYREQVMSHIDGMNMFYVAVTRAREELHLMTSSNPRNDKNMIGSILRRVLREGEDASVFAGEVRGVRTVTGEGEVLAFGSPVNPGTPEAREDKSLKTYPTSRPGAKVKLRLPSARYFESGEAELAPCELTFGPHPSLLGQARTSSASSSDWRQFGILMHRAFENASGVEDVRAAIDRMLAVALVSKPEYDHLLDVVGKAFENPLVAGWFGGEWDAVRNESNIVVPGDPGARRPDRVMLNGGSAVVVDYKFGRKTLPEHGKQLKNYMELLRGMGYTDVAGYIWYVSLDKIEPVT